MAAPVALALRLRALAKNLTGAFGMRSADSSPIVAFGVEVSCKLQCPVFLLRSTGDFLDWDIAEPSPDALDESLRAFGYSPETAIADLIDKSISASAHTVEVQFQWNGPDSSVTISDDGAGMDEPTARTGPELLPAL